jgi:sodium/bile acid cotransporter 7
LIGNWLAKKKQITNKIDRGVIVLIVYSSFCDATAAGLWHQYHWQTIGAVMGIAAVLLFVILGTTTFTARRLGFSVEDEITAVFCGSKKALPTVSRWPRSCSPVIRPWACWCCR